MKKSIKSLLNDNQISVWDDELCVWKGGSCIDSGEELPKPLYVFGYGSLMWRPGDLLSSFSSFSCQCFGYNRSKIL